MNILYIYTVPYALLVQICASLHRLYKKINNCFSFSLLHRHNMKNIHFCYFSTDIPESWKARWASLSSDPELYLPASNPFIPDEFTLLPKDEQAGEGKEYPEKLCDDPCGALWYRQDTKFGLPRSYCYVYFLTCLPLQSPRL